LDALPLDGLGLGLAFLGGWWAVASEDLIAETIDGKPAVVPRGALVRYREWYGAKKDAMGRTVPNVGLKMKNEDIGAGIKERETLLVRDDNGNERFVREAITYGVLDPLSGGPDSRRVSRRDTRARLCRRSRHRDRLSMGRGPL
jgi:hypothetical protein